MSDDKPISKPNRDKRIDIRVTAVEKKDIVAKAAAVGKEASEYLRELGLGHQLKPARPADEYRALVGIGNNLNQLVRYAHSGHDPRQWEPQLQQVLAKLDEYFL